VLVGRRSDGKVYRAAKRRVWRSGRELGHGQVTHIGIVEYADGQTIGIIQGNGKPDPSVVLRTTYKIGTGS
jgi:hypothetical protein